MREVLKATTASGEDRIGALPDEILQNVLSFLPSCQAVRTCVLARRWRHQWKSVPALRIYYDQFETDQELSVRLGENCDDVCFDSYYGNCNGFSGRCECRVSVHSGDPVLVHGLSHATNLELITYPEVFIFRKDLKRRPSFSKLKTLLLNEWCAAANFAALVYFLQHSPILEKLTLKLYKTPESMFETDGNCNPRQQPIASKHLQVVEVKYHEKEVLALQKILEILVTCGVPSKKIVTERMILWTSGRFSFEQRAQ